MLTFLKLTKESLVTTEELDVYTTFLYKHLEHYGDTKEAIAKAIAYALGQNNKPGGFVLVAHAAEQKIVGIAVLLDTLMEDFIPEHILVYLAVDNAVRGQGLGRQLLDEIKREAKGSIALHVDPDNPAQNLYERQGFQKKYIEMRLTK
ncbi:MAG: GNAT family N-acetyltransferase [Flavobacteriaceae bacterium]|jgi:ribosomal protein S18 acetylase RimI-like enzyme|nr:GNAT family N-acetyltransferase [Flavobacteriaceae bacterium]